VERWWVIFEFLQAFPAFAVLAICTGYVVLFFYALVVRA